MEIVKQFILLLYIAVHTPVCLGMIQTQFMKDSRNADFMGYSIWKKMDIYNFF